jgi:hypothetical protein
LNRLVTPLLSYVELDNLNSSPATPQSLAESVDGDLTLADIVRSLRGLYFTSTKLSVLEGLLQHGAPADDGSGYPSAPGLIGGHMGLSLASHGSFTRPHIAINRLRAVAAKDAATPDPDGLLTVFGQLFSALKTGGYTRFANAPAHAQLWNVSLSGEGSIDVGGAFRESLTLACGDLMSAAVPLFIESPNAVNSVGLNREKRIINPSATSPLHMQMFRCVAGAGCLLAVCCCACVCACARECVAVCVWL